MKKVIFSLIVSLSFLSTTDLSIRIKGISGNERVYVGLYNKRDNFKNILKTYKSKIVKSSSSSYKVIFKNIPNGIYAVSIFQDTNNNGKLDKNFLGIPTEKYGFSNNIKPIFRGANFEESKFILNSDKNLTIDIGK